jgi:NCK-associated protein 1
MLSLVSNSNQLLNPASTDTIPCEYLSLEMIERWIIFGFTVCHPLLLTNQTANELYLLALGSGKAIVTYWTLFAIKTIKLKSLLTAGWVIPLFRDEVLYIHSFVQPFFESIKGYGKKVSEVKEAYNVALQQSTKVHRERRKFLCSAMRELSLLCSDQPGLLGPKALFIFMGFCFCRDEVNISFIFATDVETFA